MSSGTPAALTVMRVARGQPRPSDSELRAAINRDREILRLGPERSRRDLAVAGPYAVLVDGLEMDEYVVWER
jgi:hypothetical protein